MADKRIRITENGPYLVSGGVPIEEKRTECNREGAAVQWDDVADVSAPGETYALCRCGHSKNKPFCDGTHVTNKFNGTETADKTPYLERAKRYEGATIDLYDCEDLCVGARFCDVGLGVWDYTLQSDQPGHEAEALRQASLCPAGRLTVATKDGELLEPDLEPAVTLMDDPFKGYHGPLCITGNIVLEGADGSEYEVRNRMTLCRCGESQNKPYCDRAHFACKHMRLDDDK